MFLAGHWCGIEKQLFLVFSGKFGTDLNYIPPTIHPPTPQILCWTEIYSFVSPATTLNEVTNGGHKGLACC